jgi:hypothetical protein
MTSKKTDPNVPAYTRPEHDAKLDAVSRTLGMTCERPTPMWEWVFRNHLEPNSEHWILVTYHPKDNGTYTFKLEPFNLSEPLKKRSVKAKCHDTVESIVGKVKTLKFETYKEVTPCPKSLT